MADAETSPVVPRPEASAGGFLAIVAPLAIAAAGCAAYANTFGVPFVFDDVASIVENPTIRSLWPLSGPLSPPAEGGLTVSGRPLLNLSLALNYAWGGLAVPGYHAVNLLIHVLAGCTLFGLVRRALRLPTLRSTWGERAEVCALAVALLWTLHPLQTESVTYVIQRAESLMGLWFLAAFYAFVRGLDARFSARWHVAAVVATLLGVGTKEVAALLPPLILLFDRTFVAGSFAEAWRRRGRVHAALFCTWLPLAALVLSTGGNRGDTMGFDVGVAWTGFWWMQAEAVVRYLALSFWPHPLIFDYGNEVTATWREALPWAAPVAILVMVAVVAIVRRSPFGFLGAWFFGILAPTCLVPSAVQAIVEHRMYLPLAAVLTGTVVFASRILSRPVFLSATAALALAAGATTFVRNADYATDEALWRDTVAKRPENARAHNNLGRAVELQGRLAEAAESYRQAAELQSDYGQAHYNHGLALFKLGRPAEALAPFDRTVAVLPHFALAHLNRGLALRALGRFGESLASLEEAVRHPPPIRQAHFHLAVALAEQGRRDEALVHYRATLRLDPADAAARLNLGILLGQEGLFEAAIVELTEAARLAPDAPEPYANLGTALLQVQRNEEALAAFERALALRPEDPQAHYNVGYALLVSNRWIEARRRLEEAVRIDPGFAPARTLLDNMGAPTR